MTFFQHQQWLISTLSPVHLGTGQDYESTSYVIDDGVMYAFSESALFKALNAPQLAQISDFAEKGNRGLQSIQKLLRSQKDELKLHSEQIIAIGDGVARFYDKRMNEDGKNFNQMLLPKTASETYTGRPFIPGTAIKGAIRTALMNKQLRDNPRITLERQERTQQILQKIHGFSKVDEDPFKTIKISDGTGNSASLHKKVVLVNSQHWDDAKKSKAARPSLLESIAAGQLNAFITDLRIWPRPKVKPVVESQLELVKTVNEFYLTKLQDELDRNSQAGYYHPSYSKALTDLLNDGEFKHAISMGSAMLLRLGKFSGAVSKTLDAVRNIKILAPKGMPSKFKSLPNEQRLVASSENGSSGCEPLGWVVLTTHGLKLDALETFAKAIYAQDEQLQRMASVADEIRHKRTEAAEKAVAKAKAAEAEAAAEMEKNQRLAAMSDAELAIYQLQERIQRGEGKGSGPGHQVWADTKAVIEQCQTWQEHEKRALWLVTKEIAQHLGIDLKKNDKAKAVIRSIGVTS